MARHTYASARRSSVRGHRSSNVPITTPSPEDTGMSGAMRRIGEYLGLLEDTGRYDDEYDEFETQETAPVAARPAKPGRTPVPAPVSDLSERRRPATGPTGVVAELSRITTLHPRTYNEARSVGENFREGTPVIMNLS